MQQTVYQNPHDDMPVGGGGSGDIKFGQDRPINASGQYDLSSCYLDELEFEDNLTEVEKATADSGLVDKVKEAYQAVLSQATLPFVA